MSISHYNRMNIDNNKISSKICQKIKLERNKKGISQLELAMRAGLNKNTIWKIETGQMSPTVQTLEKIANALELDFITLVDVSKIEL